MNLPEEVLLIIFHFSIQEQPILTTKDIYQCQLVCKRWKIAAQRTNYTCLTLQSHHNIPKLINTFLPDPSSAPGKFVKELFITVPSHQDFLIQLVDIFPFVDTIQVVDPNFEFYSNLITIHDQAKWKYLKNFSIPIQLDNLSLIQMYTNCVLKYQYTLQHILLYENNLNNNKLQQFPRLQQLTIKQHTCNKIQSLDNIIDKCKKLSKLDIALYHCESITTDYKLFDILPKPTIKLLDCLFVVQDDSLLYIMHKFPQLQELYINHAWREDSTKIIFNATKMDISLSTLSQFISYILYIPSCAISIYLDIPFITYALNTYTKLMPTKSLGPLSITYTRDNENQNTQWAMHRTTNKSQSHEFYIDYHCSTNGLLHLKLIETIGKYLTELTYRTNIDSLSHVHGYFLDHIFQYCYNLTKLRLSSTKLIRCPHHPSYHQSLTHLVLLNCYLGKDIFPQLSNRFKSLKKLVIVRCRFGNSGLDTRYFHIDMYNTNIDTIRLKSEHNSITYITLRLNQTTEETFYKLWFDKSTESYKSELSTLQEYQMMPKAEQHMKVWIQCKSIQCIQLFTNSKSTQVVFGQITIY